MEQQKYIKTWRDEIAMERKISHNPVDWAIKKTDTVYKLVLEDNGIEPYWMSKLVHTLATSIKDNITTDLEKYLGGTQIQETLHQEIDDAILYTDTLRNNAFNEKFQHHIPFILESLKTSLNSIYLYSKYMNDTESTVAEFKLSEPICSFKGRPLKI